MKWISVKNNDKNQVFQCSVCGQFVYYIDGSALGKNKTKAKAVCGYTYCPWCMAERDSND